MNSIKDLAKIAKLCRKLGITQYKCSEFEFTLSPHEQPKSRRKPSRVVEKNDLQQAIEAMGDEIPGDIPNPDDMLFWSTNPGVQPENKAE